MERDEALAILELCRPGNADDLLDPMIAQALELLESDPELKAQFEAQQALDARIADKYCEVEPPADLKASILAGMRAHAIQSEEKQVEEEPIPFPTSAQKRSPIAQFAPWAGIAAAIIVLFVVVLKPQGGTGTQYASAHTSEANIADVPAMIQFLASEIDAVTSRQRSFAKQSSQPAALQAYLASAGAPSPASLPAPVDSKPSVGCFTFDYNGVTMGMICFKEDELMHLTTVKKTDCMGEFPEEPSIYEVKDQAFKVWVEDEQVHILSVHGSKEKLPEFI